MRSARRNQPVLDVSQTIVVDSAPVGDVSVIQLDSAVDVVVYEASTICMSACNNLAKLGCSEGKNTSCGSECDHVLQTHLINFDAKCLSTAKDVKAVKVCGGITCNK